MKFIWSWIPYLLWFVMTVVLIETDFLTRPLPFFLYGLYSIVVALFLEIIRNRVTQRYIRLHSWRILLYFSINIAIGIPLKVILFYTSLPSHANLYYMYGLRSAELIADQQYGLLLYACAWFAANMILLKPARLSTAALFVASPIILYITSVLCAPLLFQLLFR
ncbi:hypothetical protein ACFQZE_05630 [Paenibacillus sp. GCM10027627]|uniref:hypothetical protein n=1 Tax=unclassified Paenibacillus TaxID=185978 RepID=UPI00363EF1EF